MKNFFAELGTFHDFKDVAKPELYADLPDDWWVAIADVAGSTKAIEAGRYKEVNTLGASVITAALNAAKGVSLPYVFGGDGATLAYPGELRAEMERVFAITRKMADLQFGMDLRIGVFSVRALREKGSALRVAKFALSPQNGLAMFQGDGFKQAEFMLKDPTTRFTYEIAPASAVSPEIFNGLECRWNAIEPKNGVILSLIVVSEKSQIFPQVIEKIDDLVGSSQAPITFEQLPMSWPPRFFRAEMRVRTAGLGPLAKVKYWLKAMLVTFIGARVMKKGGTIGDFDSKKYMTDLVANSDHRKFDEALRMVVDTSKVEADRLEDWLEQKRIRGDLCYGLFRSPAALMTCLVFSLENHVHFIDGAEGGYALAAKQLKSQLLAAHRKAAAAQASAAKVAAKKAVA